MIGETYWTLMRDPAHWLFELTLEALTFGAGAAWAWVRVRRHIHRDVDDAVRMVEQHMHDDMATLEELHRHPPVSTTTVVRETSDRDALMDDLHQG